MHIRRTDWVSFHFNLIMVDFVTRRRLVFSSLAFAFITISILFLTNFHSAVIRRVISTEQQSSISNVSTEKDQQMRTCYATEPVEIVESCQKCTAYEQRSKAIGCSPTGYKEVVLCTNTKTRTYRSCPVPDHIQRRQFWFFESAIFFIGMVAVVSVQLRQKTLDKQMVDKIKKQIGESDE